MKENTHRLKHTQTPLSELTGRLHRHARKITEPRRAILEVLQDAHRPISNKEILAALSQSGCDLATIYRSMHLMETMGMVKRVDFGDGVARFKLLEEGDNGHHHHLICTHCSDAVEIGECFPSELQDKIARRNGFSNVSHRLEFFGVCPQCQK